MTEWIQRCPSRRLGDREPYVNIRSQSGRINVFRQTVHRHPLFLEVENGHNRVGWAAMEKGRPCRWLTSYLSGSNIMRETIQDEKVKYFKK